MKQTETQAEREVASGTWQSTNGDLHGGREGSSKNGIHHQPLIPVGNNGVVHGLQDGLILPEIDPDDEAAAGADSPAFELKFLIDEERAAAVERWAGECLQGDEYGDPALGGAYRTTSLYFDTPHLDVYHRSPWYRRRKFRIRRYAGTAALFLERKLRRGDRVAKRRSSIAAEQLAWLAAPEAQADWPGYWFHRRVTKRGLGPACQIAYQRTAFVGADRLEGLRLTLDRQVHGMLTDGWCLPAETDGIHLLTGQVILEFKFRSTLPAQFKQLIATMNLNPTSVSKYRLCRDAWISAASAAERGNA